MSAKLHSQDPNSFRDSISTVDESGKRVWLFPKKPKGRYYNARKWVAYSLIAFFFAVPFIKINGQPFFMVNIIERKFVIFGNLFLPQDFFIFVIGMIMLIVFIVLFTVVYGRVWCGWACPQTVFMEMVFRRVEYWIEGDANQQRKLDKMGWTSEKILKKTAKHTIFFTFSLLIANMTLGYVYGGDQLLQMITTNPAENWTLFVAHIAFAGIFYAVFAKFREQACIAVCPYGRLQGVFLDKDSIVISYDHVRGEPRGKLQKGKKAKGNISTKSRPKVKPIVQREKGIEAVASNTIEETKKLTLEDLAGEEPKGDCIDCTLCVQVCPTGIDIRNGTQLECVNCTACIDACDEVMDKIDKPRGLIRFASSNNIEQKKPFAFTTRMLAYSIILVGLMSVVSYLLIARERIETTILRVPGMMYQEVDNGDIRNMYTIQVVNKSNEQMPIHIELQEIKGEITVAGGDMVLEEQGQIDGAFFIEIPRSELEGMKNKIYINVYSNGELLEVVKTNFLGPAK